LILAPFIGVVLVFAAYTVSAAVVPDASPVDSRLPPSVHMIAGGFPDDGAGWGTAFAAGLGLAGLPYALPLTWPFGFGFALAQVRGSRVSSIAAGVLVIQAVAWVVYAWVIVFRWMLLRGLGGNLSVSLSQGQVSYADRAPVEVDPWAVAALLLPSVVAALAHIGLAGAVILALSRNRDHHA